MGQKNIWPTTIKYSSVIVLDKNGNSVFYSRIYLRFCKIRRGVLHINYMRETLTATYVSKNLESLCRSAQE